MSEKIFSKIKKYVYGKYAYKCISSFQSLPVYYEHGGDWIGFNYGFLS